ncbi:MAG: hypothetical protein ACOYLV_13020 [Rubrivivax sp.]
MKGNSMSSNFDGRRMPGPDVWWMLIAAIAGAGALATTLGAVRGGLFVPRWHAEFLALAGALLLPVPFVVLDRLQAERRVWAGRAAPLAGWHAALSKSRRTLLLSWGLAVLPLVLMRLLTRPAAEAWAATVMMALFTAALLAGALALGMLAAAAWQGLLAGPTGAAAGMAALGVLPSGVAAVAPEGLPAWGTHLGWPVEVMAAGALASVLAAGLAWRAVRFVQERLERPLGGLFTPPSPRQRVQDLRLHAAQRWGRVDATVNVGMLAGVAAQLPTNLTHPDVDMHFFQAWGSSVSPLHGLRLALIALLVSFLLRGVAPHWRDLLAPGSGFRRAVGPRVVASTMASVMVQLVLLLAMVVAVFSLVPFMKWPDGTSWASLPGVALSYGVPLLADVALAVSLAAWLRGQLGSLGRLVGVVAGLGAAWAAMVFLVSPLMGIEGFARSTLWTRGPAHLAGELALAACFTLLAQRAWARADLGTMVRRPRSLMENGF